MLLTTVVVPLPNSLHHARIWPTGLSVPESASPWYFIWIKDIQLESWAVNLIAAEALPVFMYLGLP